MMSSEGRRQRAEDLDQRQPKWLRRVLAGVGPGHGDDPARSSRFAARRSSREFGSTPNFMLCVDVSAEHSVLQCAAAADNSGRNLSVPGP